MHNTAVQVATIGPSALPSICFYSFLNASQGMTDIAFSDDSTLCATAFDDARVRVWSLTGRHLREMKRGKGPLRYKWRPVCWPPM